MIRTEVLGEVPPWVHEWQGSLTPFRRGTLESIPGTTEMPHLIGSRGVFRSTGDLGVRCFNNDGQHVCQAPVLNPSLEPAMTLGRMVAFLYEEYMYLARPSEVVLLDSRVMADHQVATWWSFASLDEPGWYGRDGRPAEVTVTYGGELSDSDSAVALRVAGRRDLEGSRYTHRWPGRPAGAIGSVGDFGRVSSISVDWWMVVSTTRPGEPQAEGSTEPQAEATADQVIAEAPVQEAVRDQEQELRDRFSNIMEALKERANDTSPSKGTWCSEYEEAMDALGVDEADYSRRTNVKYSVRVDLSYSLSPSDLDSVTRERFGGDHDIQDSVEWESTVWVEVEGSRDSEVTDLVDGEVLSAAGYSGYDSFDVSDWEEVE